MKLLVLLLVVACSYAAKLDRTYLPPANAATAGGGPGSLTAPGNRPSGSVPLGFSGPSGNLVSGQSSFGKPSTPVLGQQSVSSFGQPDGSFINQPTGQGLNQPPAFGFQTPSSQYAQPAGETGFGKLNAVTPTFAKAPIGFGQAPTSFGQSLQEQADYQRFQPERARASIDRNAEILRYDNQNDGETFAYSFETSNGISAEESGVATNGVRAQGGFAYTDDDGQVIRVTYTADENGYQPQGDHLPTPHPIPEEILKSIEENARAAAAGTQEGAYNTDEDIYTPQQFNGGALAYQGQGRDSSQNAYNQLQVPSPSQERGSSLNAYNQPQGQSPGQGRGSSLNAYNQPQAQSLGQGRGSSQNTYNQPQGQSPASQLGSLSVGSEVSRKTPSLGFQGSNKLGQSTSGFTQSKESLTLSGYQYNQPQANLQFGRPSASFIQTGAQYRPESVPSGQPQGSLVGSSPRESDKGFAPSGSNGQISARPSAGSPLSGKPKGSITESAPTYSGFGSAPGFGQSPSGPASQGSKQYQPSQSESGSSMPAQSSPYQYNRPSQKVAPSQQSAAQPGFRPTTAQVASTQKFGAPRQPPSFTDEEGYKY